MKNKKLILIFGTLALILALLLSSCGESIQKNDGTDSTSPDQALNFEATFGESLDSLGVYDGLFEGDVKEIEVKCVSGTPNAFKLEGNTLTFTSLSADSVYSISGKLKGNIVVDVGDEYKLDIELCGFSLISNSTNPILINSGDEVSITAKKNCKNYIYDTRARIDETDETLFSGAIHSLCDLEICGKGSLSVVSEQNNGIHTKDDLKVKNLTLTVACADNALKGNDSVSIESGNTTLIAFEGDGIKTSNSDVSSKGNQRGTVSILSGTHTIYAARDGIDASFDVNINGEDTSLTVYTGKYSNYTAKTEDTPEEPQTPEGDFGRGEFGMEEFGTGDFGFEGAPFHREEMTLPEGEIPPSRNDRYKPNKDYGGMARPGGNNGGGRPGGFGGMGDGNTEKSAQSAKGIKAANEVNILAGTVSVKAFDDALHAGDSLALENGNTPTGNVSISGGTLTLFSSDDAVHADGILTVTGGNINILSSYEGLEGTKVVIDGGNISAKSSDDGINSTGTTDVGITVNGGSIYVYAGGDGLDSNSRSSYNGIVFAGGDVVVISTSGGNSPIDSEQGYTYEGGRVLALMPSGAMSSEATHAKKFSSIGTSQNLSLEKDSYLKVECEGEAVAIVKIPTNISGRAIYLGNNTADITTINATESTLDINGVWWE